MRCLEWCSEKWIVSKNETLQNDELPLNSLKTIYFQFGMKQMFIILCVWLLILAFAKREETKNLYIHTQKQRLRIIQEKKIVLCIWFISQMSVLPFGRWCVWLFCAILRAWQSFYRICPLIQLEFIEIYILSVVSCSNVRVSECAC